MKSLCRLQGPVLNERPLTDMKFTAETDIDDLLASLTPEQKARLVNGATNWSTAEIDEAGVPSLMLTDGPHGLRKQDSSGDHLGLTRSVPATCFPPAAALGSSFDSELAERVGAAIADEARAEGVGVVLGPGLNIKRSPLCGRNFEYFSEDPVVSGKMAAAVVKGIQSRGVGACPKHFAVNNQEADRMRVSAEVDPRTLREIYLKGFEDTVKQAQPWAIMSAYNKINGVYASESNWLLTRVLRQEWGFDGAVVSDWYAVGDPVASLQAGLDLEMPTTRGRSTQRVLDGLEEGDLSQADLDRAAGRVLTLVQRCLTGDADSAPSGSRSAGSGAAVSGSAGSGPAEPGAAAEAGAPDRLAQHALAKEAALRSAVLLKNKGGLLPLSKDASVAAIGEFAHTPRYQGAGSSHINPTKIDTALEAIEELAAGAVRFAPGFLLEEVAETGGPSEADTAVEDRLLTEAEETAASCDVAVVFIGLPESAESEGYDREHIELPPAQLRLLDRVLEANPRTAVVLSNGSVVALPFRDQVPAILEGWLLGQAGGSATADLLYGAANPSGKLAETIPLRLQDTPAYGHFPGENGAVTYGEGLFVGYRHYELRQLEVAYPFGHGLSYTDFEYSDLRASVAGNDLKLTLEIHNTGQRSGREVVQAYVGKPESPLSRAPKELKAFTSVELNPGESRVVQLHIPEQSLAYWDIRHDDWVVEPGTYQVSVGSSSQDIRQTAEVELTGEVVALPLSEDSTFGDALLHPAAGTVAHQKLTVGSANNSSPFSEKGLLKVLESFPLKRLSSFSHAGLSDEDIQEIIAASR